MYYERGLHTHSSSHALRTRTPHTLVKSCITHEDSAHTLNKSCITHEDSTHTLVKSSIMNEDSTHTLVKSCITNEDSAYTRQVMHYTRGLHVHSSSHALRPRTPHTLISYERELTICETCALLVRTSVVHRRS